MIHENGGQVRFSICFMVLILWILSKA
jgi:hypothetical protein